MRHLALVLGCLLVALPGLARAADKADKPIKVKVIKRKKGRALIKHTKKMRLKRGKVYYLTTTPPSNESDEELDDYVRESAEAARKWVAGANIDVSMSTRDSGRNLAGNSDELQQFNIQALVGRNLGRFEIGLFAEHEFLAIGVNDTSALLGGVFADFNITKNTVDRDFVFGGRVAGGYGTADESIAPEAGTLSRVAGTGFIKWFGLSTSTAIMLQGGIQLDNVAFENYDVRTTGTVVKLGAQVYF